jgi:hypothetical protein
MTSNFFHSSVLLLFLDPRSGIQDPGSGIGKNQVPGSGINIPNLQHCVYLIFLYKGLQREIFLGVTSQSKLLGLLVNRISAPPPHPQYVGTVHTIYTKLEEMKKIRWGWGVI